MAKQDWPIWKIFLWFTTYSALSFADPQVVKESAAIDVKLSFFTTAIVDIMDHRTNM